MSKLLSEEQIFEAFMSHIENVRHTSLRKHLASPSLEIYVNQFLKGEYDAFKAAFNLLMPIIQKQREALEATWPGESGAVVRVHHDEALQETKQMLEKLGEKK